MVPSTRVAPVVSLTTDMLWLHSSSTTTKARKTSSIRYLNDESIYITPLNNAQIMLWDTRALPGFNCPINPCQQAPQDWFFPTGQHHHDEDVLQPFRVICHVFDGLLNFSISCVMCGAAGPSFGVNDNVVAYGAPCLQPNAERIEYSLDVLPFVHKALSSGQGCV